MNILEYTPPEESEVLRAIVDQHKMILEMNKKIIEALATPPFVIAKEENGHKI